MIMIIMMMKKSRMRRHGATRGGTVAPTISPSPPSAPKLLGSVSTIPYAR